MLRHMESKEVIDYSQQGFTKSKLCLKNLVTFYEEVTVTVDMGKATEVICLDLCKIFDTVPYDIIVPRVEKHGFDGCTASRIRN